MKKIFGIVFTIVLLASVAITPVAAAVNPIDAAGPIVPEVDEPVRPEPELLPQEIIDEFADGMTIEEFLIRNQGPIPNALIEYADMPVAVIVQLDKPSLIEYVNEHGMDRASGTDAQVDYVAELKSDQSAILSEISAGRAGDVQQIGESFTKVLNGFMLYVPAKMVNEIRAIPGVKSVSQAPEYEINVAASSEVVRAIDVWEIAGYTGEGVTIAVIDTGIDYTHAMFGGSGDPLEYSENDPDIIEEGTFPTAKVIGGYDFAGTDYTGSNVPVPDDDPLDEGGHGTHVASIAAGYDIGFGSGIAPGASLYALKIFGADGSTRLTLHAIEWAMDPLGLGHLGEPVDVINMSLGADWGPADENDPEFIAVENATSIGVVVVASAGNAGDSSYIVGSPSTVDSAISVAASATGIETLPYIEYGESDRIPYSTSDAVFDSNIVATMVDISVAIDPTGFLCTVPSGQETALTGQVALISRGDCSFEDKINNAASMGAVAAVIYNNTTGIINMAVGSATLPAGSIVQDAGLLLKGLAPLTVSIGPDNRVDTFESLDPMDSIGDFSSRGPRGFDSKLKPEITAPGASIYAAAMGTGDDGTTKGGTSMAAPMVAGVAALVLQANPGFDPIHVKAAMMNNAVDLVGDASGDVPRIGAGRVDAFASVITPAVAYADPELVSLSWGVIELMEDYTDTKAITLKSYYDGDIEFNVAAYFTSDDTGATMTPEASTVVLPAYGVTSIDVTLDLIADDLYQYFGYQEEYYGYVVFSAFDGELTLKVPFYFVPRPYTELTELFTWNEFEVYSDYGEVDFGQDGPIASSLWAYPVTLTSDNDPAVLDGGDLRYIGMDYGGSSPYGDIFVPAFAMWGDVHTNQPYFNEVDMYVDTPYGSVVNFNYNYGAMTGGDGTNDWMVAQVDFSDGMMYLGSPYLIYADFNSGFQEWYLPAAWQYVLDVFRYEVVSYDWNGNYDYAGYAYFDLSRLPVAWGFTDYEPHETPAALLYWVDSWQGLLYADIQGMMIVDYNGQPGAGQTYYWPIEVFGETMAPVFLH
ncbi:MAG: S8 family serine peptidase [Anaerolineaceae bacterium]|nr:S8 family serine peptidase [Anaerolineaceae bacterium]